MKLSRNLPINILALVLLLKAAALGDTVTFTTQNSVVSGKRNQGWYSPTKSHDPSNPIYVTGNAGSIGGPYAQYRSFFTFNLTSLTANVVSAQFQLTRFGSVGRETTDRNGVPINDTNSGVSQQLSVWDVATGATLLNTASGINQAIYDDLGSGTLFGTYTEAQHWDPDGVLTINLDAAAIATINRTHGAISFGLSLNADTTQNDNIFGNTGGAYNGTQALVLTTAVPEPSPWALLGAGVAGLGVVALRRSRV